MKTLRIPNPLKIPRAPRPTNLSTMRYRAEQAPFYKSEEWKKLKAEKERVTKKACVYCRSAKNVELHHMRPRGKQGEDSIRNTIWVCEKCHKKLHS